MNGSIVEMHRNKCFSKDRLVRSFVSLLPLKRLISQRCDVANGINVFTASVANSGYLFLRVNQNLSNSLDEHTNFKVLSDDN
jgi:hypothetical protein